MTFTYNKKAKFTKFFHNEAPRLRRYARALCGSMELADDLLQDCFERAWKNVHRWQPENNGRAWLFTILHNVFITNLNRYEREVPLELRDDDLFDEDTNNNLILIYDMEKALRSLTPEQREVLLLAGLEQMAYEEIAATLGIPLGTVMSRLSRAREKLRSIMEVKPKLSVVSTT